MTVSSSAVSEMLRAHPRPQQWTATEVRKWLEAIGLDVYAPTFEAAGVQGGDLVTMDAEALKRRLGVASLGHRSQLLQHIAVLAARAAQSIKREGVPKEIAASTRRKQLLDSMCPDRLRREAKAAQDEKLVEARTAFWTPKDRGHVPRARPAVTANKAADASAQDTSAEGLGGTEAPVRTGPGARVARRPLAARPRPMSGRGGGGGGGGWAGEEGGGREGSGEEEDEEVFLTPEERKTQVAERIAALDGRDDNHEELIKAWVEYGACIRMEHSDMHPELVRAHFNLATTYLRHKYIPQALAHFKAAEGVNEANPGAPDSAVFRCRILEGMGICETRLAHFSVALALLTRAEMLCMQRQEETPRSNDSSTSDGEGGGGGGRGGGGEEEEEGASDTAVASVLVALSELHSAQAHYEGAVDCLLRAWEIKEVELGPGHVQIGKLFSAMGSIKQKHLRQKVDALADVQATLQSAVRIKTQIDDKTEGIQLAGTQHERGVMQLKRDIGHMKEKRGEYQREVRLCKADVLDYLNRARQIALASHADTHPETVPP